MKKQDADRDQKQSGSRRAGLTLLRIVLAIVFVLFVIILWVIIFASIRLNSNEPNSTQPDGESDVLANETSMPSEAESLPPASITTPKSTQEPPPSASPSSSPIPAQKLTGIEASELEASAQSVYYGVYLFESSEYLSSGNSAPVQSASVIKVFIMEYAFSLITDGELSEEETLGGITVYEQIRRMIQNSDNSATNTLIDKLGMDNINAFIQAAGYKDTKLGRKMLDFNAINGGKDNYTSLDDTIAFLKKLYENKTVYPYSEMLDIMKGQTVKTKLPVKLPAGTVIAHKTGELEYVENDIGIVFGDSGKSQNDFAIVVLTIEPIDNAETRAAISRFARNVFDAIN